MAADTPKLTDFLTSISHERLIEIQIAEEPSVFVLRSVLYDLSAYFEAALSDEQFLEAKTGVLTFPNDSPESWKILLFWAHHHRLPSLNEMLSNDDVPLERLVGCWILGDIYHVPAFQNAIMMQLDDCIHSRDFKISAREIPAIVLAFQSTPQGSQLRLFMGIVVVYKFKNWDDMKDEVLDELEDIPGALMDVLHAFQFSCTNMEPPSALEWQVPE